MTGVQPSCGYCPHVEGCAGGECDPKLPQYQLRFGDGPWRRVTKEEYVAVEREAGFVNTMGRPDEPACASFGVTDTLKGSPGIRGRVVHAGWAEATAVLDELASARKTNTCRMPLMVSYTNSDDGIWASCDEGVPPGSGRSGWQRNLGYFPTTVDVVWAQKQHDTEHVLPEEKS